MWTEARLLALAALLALAGCECPNGSTAPGGAGRGGAAARGPLLLEDAGAGPCPHPYFPMEKGVAWRYELGGEEGPRRATAELEVLAVEEREGALTAKLRRSVGVMVTEVELSCSDAGTSFLAAFVPLGPPLPVAATKAPRITSSTGALLPPPGDLREGAEWTHDLTAHTEIGGRTPLTMDSVWQAQGHWLRRREVTVPAGRYDVIQVRYDVTVHHRPPEEEDVTFGDRVMDPPTMSFTYSLARGVGVVLIEGEPLPDRPNVRARWALTGVTRGGADQR